MSSLTTPSFLWLRQLKAERPSGTFVAERDLKASDFSAPPLPAARGGQGRAREGASGGGRGPGLAAEARKRQRRARESAAPRERLSAWPQLAAGARGAASARAGRGGRPRSAPLARAGGKAAERQAAGRLGEPSKGERPAPREKLRGAGGGGEAGAAGGGGKAEGPSPSPVSRLVPAMWPPLRLPLGSRPQPLLVLSASSQAACGQGSRQRSAARSPPPPPPPPPPLRAQELGWPACESRRAPEPRSPRASAELLASRGPGASDSWAASDEAGRRQVRPLRRARVQRLGRRQRLSRAHWLARRPAARAGVAAGKKLPEARLPEAAPQGHPARAPPWHKAPLELSAEWSS